MILPRVIALQEQERLKADGTVGPIGGIQHKIIAADREKADYFFAPKDMTYKDGTKIENYSACCRESQSN